MRVRAIIITEIGVVVIRRRRGVKSPPYFVLPGGGVEASDRSLEDAVRRECYEELGVEVNVISKPIPLKFSYEGENVSETIFRCKIISGILGTGTGEEMSVRNSPENSYSVIEVPLDKIPQLNLLPVKLKKFLQNDQN